MEIRLSHYKLSKILCICALCVVAVGTLYATIRHIQCSMLFIFLAKHVTKYISYVKRLYMFFERRVSCGSSDRYKCGIRLNNFCCSRLYSPPIIPSIYIRFIFLYTRTHCIFFRQSWQVLFVVVVSYALCTKKMTQCCLFVFRYMRI